MDGVLACKVRALPRSGKVMSETKHMQQLRENYVFTLRMRKVSEKQWEGEVVRYPRSKQQSVVWGKACGTLCHADSEKGLKKQLDAIVNEYDR